MSKSTKKISEYEFKDDQCQDTIKFLTLEKTTPANERTFVKNVQV